jgi:hypothetical protein
VVAVSVTNVGADRRGRVVRTYQVLGIDSHQTPALSEKPARWLPDVVLPASIGSGTHDDRAVTAVHHTPIQTAEDPYR